ncbi:MAG TPA: 2-succinyl-5-enolpyruvyl-6-hydroxy-3-cyclohexene-1-carboxylic-acid synthase [Actinomycetes bacterium]|nr:2-succinyl-5-enolpyruvyl-6-hydroxy-3-cyclohexene-1-carboxylic-acid synthase [Actinomycetes bacterium]
MNPSTALATVLVDELVRGGVREAVLAPGSRNAPLAFALHAADRDGRLRLHVRIDERSAGFLALGLAKASGRPVPVVTTSGTAAVNVHPAVVEADHSGVPLLVLTADRPVELRGVGANQTIEQLGLFVRSVRHVDELSVDRYPDGPAQRRCVAAALEASRTGPVHLDVAFREPLVPTRDPGEVRPDGGPRSSGEDAGGAVPWAGAQDGPGTFLEAGPRTVVVAGDRGGWEARWVAEAASWPLLAEPSSGARSGPNALATYRLLLDRLGPEVERVVVYGRPTLSRPVTRLLAREDVEVVVVPRTGRVVRLGPREPLVAAAAVPGWVPKAAPRAEPDDWLTGWLDADAKARDAVHEVVAAEPVSGLGVAWTLAAELPRRALLVAGSSSAVRDLDLADVWDDPLLDESGRALVEEQRTVLANRGASGIDGTVSTAVGAALAHQQRSGGRAYALVGDLTFLHDSNGLVIGPDEPRPDLTVVVVNDDGGGLFTLLEQGAPEHAEVFERVFGTPHGVDLEALCRATSTSYARPDSLDDVVRELSPRAGLHVVEVRTDRSRTRDLHAMLRAAAESALR